MVKDIYNDVPGQSEEALQQKSVFWFNNEYPQLRGCLFHVPNGGSRNAREAKKFKLIGLVPGVSDLILLYNGRAYLLEAKTEKGTQRAAQVRWEEKVKEQGFPYFIFRSLTDFKKIIKGIIKQ